MDCDCVYHGHGPFFRGPCQSPNDWLLGTHLLESFLKCTKANIELTKVIQDHQGGSDGCFRDGTICHDVFCLAQNMCTK